MKKIEFSNHYAMPSFLHFVEYFEEEGDYDTDQLCTMSISFTDDDEMLFENSDVKFLNYPS